MGSETIPILIVFAVGILLICISLLIKGSADKTSDNGNDDTLLEDSFTAANRANENLVKTISDADEAMNHLSSMSDLILNEIADKYKELLFLYQLIDEKKSELQTLYATKVELPKKVTESMSQVVVQAGPSPKPTPAVVDLTVDEPDMRAMNPFSSNEKESLMSAVKERQLPKHLEEKHAKIVELCSQGLTVAEVGRELNMGQGEIMLILDMRRGAKA